MAQRGPTSGRGIDRVSLDVSILRPGIGRSAVMPGVARLGPMCSDFGGCSTLPCHRAVERQWRGELTRWLSVHRIVRLSCYPPPRDAAVDAAGRPPGQDLFRLRAASFACNRAAQSSLLLTVARRFGPFIRLLGPSSASDMAPKHAAHLFLIVPERTQLTRLPGVRVAPLHS